jgi:hypothetical protein
MKKIANLKLFVVMVAVLMISPSFGSWKSEVSGAPATTEQKTFSIIWITDTQYLSADHPTYFSSLCQWIVSHETQYNVEMVVHTGDLVDSEGNVTQWMNANSSMSLLLNAGIPYCWDAGNHDYNSTCWIGNEFAAFNPGLQAQKPHWIDDSGDGQNTAVHFEVEGQDFLIANIAYLADDTVLSWADDLIDSHPDSHVIVATHFYLNRTGGYESWASNFRRTVLANNTNVFLTLSAHVYPLSSSGFKTQVGDRHELVFNRQEKDNNMGAASLRILTFNLSAGTIDVQTFYLYANMFLTDSDNQFSLRTSFRNEAAANESNEIPELPELALLTLMAALLVIAVAAKVSIDKWPRHPAQVRILWYKRLSFI